MKHLPTVVEAYYTPQDLAALWRFNQRKIRDLAKAGEFTVKDAAGQIVAEPMEIAGELRIPASAVNAYAKAHPLVYNEGIKARNRGELLRRIQDKQE